MKVYRVYYTYHESSESGTFEFGCFSTPEKAQKRLAEVWKERNYPEPSPENKTDAGWYFNDGWKDIYILIQEFTVDNPIENENVGYT